MNDYIFIFFTIFITTGLIYILYKIMLGSADRGSKDSDLQITSLELVEQLNILRKQKKYNIVETLAKKYLEKKGNDDDVRTVLAKSLHDEKKIYDAIEHAKIIARHQPRNSNIKIFVANCYKEVEKPMKAIAVLQEILEWDSDNVVALKELAQSYLDTNQKLSAIKMLKKLEEFLDNNFEKAKNKTTVADIYIEFKDYEAAIEEYESILEIYPEDIKIKKRLIELYNLTSNYDALIEIANEILETNAHDEVGLWTMKTLMNVYNSKHQYDKALEFANQIKDHPLSDKIQSGEEIAKILLEQDQVDSSIEIIKSLLEQSPDNVSLKKDLARAYEKKKDFEAAVSIYLKILDDANVKEIESIHYEMSNIYTNWAMHLFYEKDNDECFKHFTIALKYYNQNPDLHFKIGNVNKEIKNLNEAISQYKKAIELDPDNIDYYYALSECYEELDNIYEQKKVLLDILNLNTNNYLVYYKLGIIYRIQNDLSSAISNLKKAIKLNENFVDAKCKLALIYEHMGNKEEAILLYEDILKIDPENEDVKNNLKMLKSQ